MIIILYEKYALLSLEIYNYRKKFIDDINMYLGNSFKYIAGYDNLVIKYASNFSNFDNETFLEKLNDNLNRDIQYKMTLIGPNRDDFYFLLGDKNLSLYGSQGQIRSAVLALKLSEVKLFNNITGDTPILLLDDMFSELDINKRNNILKYLDRNIQTIINIYFIFLFILSASFTITFLTNICFLSSNIFKNIIMCTSARMS